MPKLVFEKWVLAGLGADRFEEKEGVKQIREYYYGRGISAEHLPQNQNASGYRILFLYSFCFVCFFWIKYIRFFGNKYITRI